jgi:hypothetical protein
VPDAGATKRAREKLTPKSSKEDRVNFIVDEMANGRWDGYSSRAAIAEACGLAEATIRHDSAEAHRIVAYDPQEREEKRRTLAAFIAKQRERASEMVNVVTGLPDFGAMCKATELEAKLVGIELDKSTPMTGPDRPVVEIRVLSAPAETPQGTP